MKITVYTNIPCLSGVLFDHNLNQIRCTPAPANLLCHYEHLGVVEEREIASIVFDNLSKGLYQLRLELPYYNQGQLFEMPIVMDKFIPLFEENGDVEFTFMANLVDGLPKEIKNPTTV